MTPDVFKNAHHVMLRKRAEFRILTDGRRNGQGARTRKISVLTRKIAAAIMYEVERQTEENTPPVAVVAQMRAEMIIRAILEDVL